MFRAQLIWILQWRSANPHGGIDLADDDMLRLLDFRFADDMPIVATTKVEAKNVHIKN